MRSVVVILVFAVLLVSCAPRIVRWRAPEGRTGGAVVEDMRECGYGGVWDRGFPIIGPALVVLPVAGVVGLIRHLKHQEREDCMTGKGYCKEEEHGKETDQEK